MPTPENRKESILDAMGDGIVTAGALSKSTGCSVRTIYRHIDMLRREGHRIIGEAGVGYMLMRRAPGREVADHG
jgi:predicted DNA-binding transcriptional regulator YafY